MSSENIEHAQKRCASEVRCNRVEERANFRRLPSNEACVRTGVEREWPTKHNHVIHVTQNCVALLGVVMEFFAGGSARPYKCCHAVFTVVEEKNATGGVGKLDYHATELVPLALAVQLRVALWASTSLSKRSSLPAGSKSSSLHM